MRQASDGRDRRDHGHSLCATKLSCHCPASDYYPGMRGLKVASRRLPTPLLQAYVCKSDLYLNIIDFRPRIRYRERVSYCVRLISMAFLSAEHDKCIWKIKCCGWVRSAGSLGALSYSNILRWIPCGIRKLIIAYNIGSRPSKVKHKIALASFKILK